MLRIRVLCAKVIKLVMLYMFLAVYTVCMFKIIAKIFTFLNGSYIRIRSLDYGDCEV